MCLNFWCRFNTDDSWNAIVCFQPLIVFRLSLNIFQHKLPNPVAMPLILLLCLILFHFYLQRKQEVAFILKSEDDVLLQCKRRENEWYVSSLLSDFDSADEPLGNAGAVRVWNQLVLDLLPSVTQVSVAKCTLRCSQRGAKLTLHNLPNPGLLPFLRGTLLNSHGRASNLTFFCTSVHIWHAHLSHMATWLWPVDFVNSKLVPVRVSESVVSSSSSISVVLSQVLVWDTGVAIIGIELWCDHFNNKPAVCSYTKLLPFGRYWIYLLQLMSVAYFQGVSDMSIIYNNTLITESLDGLFLTSDHYLILCEQNWGFKTKHWKLIIVAYW